MAFTKNYMNELFRTVLVLSALLSTTSAVDCYGKSFHCVNSTHFMICVDLGGGVSQAIEDFYIACPPPTLCQGNNHFECEFPAPTTPVTTLNNAIKETTLPWEEIVTVSSLNNTTKEFSENYMDTTTENGTTTAVKYSVTTDTTLDVTSKTAPAVYISSELNLTEVPATIAAETTTTPVEIIPLTLYGVTPVTQTTDVFLTTGIEIAAQRNTTAETTDYTQTGTVVAGEESISSAVNNTHTITENKVITETVIEQTDPITTEQIIQTTTNDPFEQEPAYLNTDLPQVITSFQNKSTKNNSLPYESSVGNKNVQATEKPKLNTLDNSTKNKDLFSIPEKANVTQPNNISQNVEITSTVESILEIKTASTDHAISIPSDNITTGVYHGSTAPSIDNEIKLYHSDLHKDIAPPTNLEGTIESKLTSDKEENKESKIHKINHAVEEIKPTVGQRELASNNENLSTTPYNDVFPELAVTTNLPFVKDAKANAVHTLDTNVIDNQPVIVSANAQNNELSTTLDGIFATETFGNDLSSARTTTTETFTTAGIEIVAQRTAETTNYTQTGTVVAGEESISSAINNTRTITENKVITETVTEQTDPITTEQIIQTTTNDPFEQKPAYLYSDLPQVITLFQKESIKNNTLPNESSVGNKNVQAAEKSKLNTLDNGIKNKELFSISEKANVTQPNNISQNDEISSTVESILEMKTASTDYSISIPSDNIPTGVYQGSTAPSIDNEIKLYHSGLHEDIAPATNLDGTIESKLTSDKEENKESKINKINHAVEEIKPTVGQRGLASNNENLLTTPYNDVFPELIVTTDLPFVNNAKANAVHTSDTNVIDNQPVIISSNAKNNEVSTTLDEILATEMFGNDLSSAQTTTTETTTGIESVAQRTAETTNYIQTGIVVAGEERITSAINNTQTTTENKVITETVTEQTDPITTEQIIQTTTNDHFEQEPAYLYTDLPQVSTLFQSENIKNRTTNTLPNESSLGNRNVQATEKPKLNTLDNGTKNKALFSISEKANVTQPNNISQNVEISSTVESIREIKTATIDHFTSIPSDKIPTDVYHGSTAPSFDNEIKLYYSGSHTNTAAPTKFERTIESKLTTDKEENKESKMSTINHAEDKTKPTVRQWDLASNNENLSTTPSNDVFPELAVTTDLPFVNDAKANAINTLDINVIDNQTVTISTNPQNNDVLTTLDGIFATDTFGNDSSSARTTTINEGNLTKESTQNVVTVNLDIAIQETAYTTVSNSNFQSVTTQAPLVMVTSKSSIDSELGKAFIIGNVENTASTEQPTTIDQQSLTIGTTENIVTEKKFIPISEAIYQGVPATDAINKPTKVVNGQPTITEVPSQTYEDTKLDSAYKVNKETVATDLPAHITAQPMVTESPNTQSERPSTHNLVNTELDGRFVSENVENTVSTEQPTTVYESLTVEPRRNAVYQSIVSIEAMYEPTHSTMTAAQSFVTKTQNIGSASIVQFGASTKQTKLINEEIRTTNIPDIVNAKPIMTEGPSLGTETRLKHSNTVNEQSLDTLQNVVVEDIIIPTSEVVDRGIMSTEAIHESKTIINLQPMTTEAPSNLTKTQNSETTKQETAFIVKKVEFGVNTEQFGTTDTSANIETEKIIAIATKQAAHSIISTTKPPRTELNTITEAPLLTTKGHNPITKQVVTMHTQIEENGAISEITITPNKESSTTNTEQNVVTDIIITPIRHAVILENTTRESLYTQTSTSNEHLIPAAAEHMSNKAQLITTQIPTSGTVTDRALKSERIGNSTSTTQQTVINEESVTTDIAASIIIPKTQIVNENRTATEDVNIKKVLLPSLEYTGSITETGVTDVVTKPAVLSFEQKKLQLSENNLILGAELKTVVELKSDTYNLQSTNALELNFNMEPTIGSINGDTVIIDKGSNTMASTSPSVQSVNINHNIILNSALSNETKINGSQISSGINVPENLTSLQYLTHGTPKQNTNNIVLSESLGPKIGTNDISKPAFWTQQSENETIPVSNDTQYSTVQQINIERNNQAHNINLNPLENYLIDNSNQNPKPAIKSSVNNLNVEQNGVDALRLDKAFVSQQPLKSTVHASSSIFDGPNKSEQSTTGTQTFTQIITNGLPENIKKANSEHKIDTLSAPNSEITENSIHQKTSTLSSGGLAVVSSPTTVQTRVAVGDTTMLDSTQNAYKTISAFLRPGSKPTVDVTDNNPGELGSNANVFQDKTESQIPKKSIDSVPPSPTVIYQYKLTTNGQDFSETFSTETSTKRNIMKAKVNASRKPMLDVLPLPINNVELRSPVTNIPVVRDLMVRSQNENTVQITESYKSVSFNPALANTERHMNFNGAHITTAPTLRNPTLNMQAGFTDIANINQNPALEDSAIVEHLYISSVSDGAPNSATEGIYRADIYPQNLQQVEQGPIEKTGATDYPHIQSHTEQRENKTIQNVFSPISTTHMRVPPEAVPETKNLIQKSNSNHALDDSIVNTVDQKTISTVITDLKYASQNGSDTERKPQQNYFPTNYTLSTQTQKTYTSSTVRAPSQSATQKPISYSNNITKPLTNDAITFNCINGIRGRYSDKDDCRKFYICFGNNQPIVGNCPVNTVFSDVKKLCTRNLSHCIRQNEFKCPSAGRFSDFMKDNVYYICINHKNHLYKFKFQCQKGYIFNKTIVKCTETKEIESNESVSIATSDSSSQNGSGSTISSSANSNTMKSGTMSNTSNGGDSSSKSEDSSKTKKSNETEETPEEPEGNENKVKEDDDEDEVFKCKKEGRFPIRNECRRYYLCKKKRSQYRRKVKKCESGKVFHKDKKKCVDADDYEC